MTNATKANVIALLNAALGAAVLFGLALSPDQIAGILGVANAAGVVFVSLTFKNSPKRLPEGVEVEDVALPPLPDDEFQGGPEGPGAGSE